MGRAQITVQRAGDGDGPGWHAEQRLGIGRLPSCDIVLNDASISRQHAEVVHTDHGWVVRDLGSTNGTLLNGVRLGRIAQRLHLGDQLQPGRILLSVTALVDALADQQPAAAQTNGPVVAGTSFGLATAEFAVFSADSALATEGLRDAPPEVSVAQDPLRAFLATSLRGAVDAVAAQGGAVFLWEPPARKLVLKASCRAGGADAAAPPVHKLIQCCFQQAASLLGTDAAEDDASTASRSLLCVSLRDGERPLGVLFVERSAAQPFGDREQLIGQAVAWTMSAGVISAQQQLDQQRTLFMQTLLTLAQAVDCRDPYTAGHTQRVTDYVLMLAEELQVGAADYHHLQIGTPLYDIGKLGIDDAILRKPGRLTPAEFALVKTHPSKGVALLVSIPELESVLPIVGSHHEHWDGSGYPDGLIGEIIPRLARMVTVADVFDALTSDRPYRKALSPAEAFSYLHRNAGTLFDPQYTQAFLRLRPRLEKRLRERNDALVTVSKRELDDLKETLHAAGVARLRRPR